MRLAASSSKEATEVGLAGIWQSTGIGNSRFRWAAVSKEGNGQGRASGYPCRCRGRPRDAPPQVAFLKDEVLASRGPAGKLPLRAAIRHFLLSSGFIFADLLNFPLWLMARQIRSYNRL